MSKSDPISLRLPEALKASLQEASTDAGRSLNAEIRMRLEWSFSSGFDGKPSDKMLGNEIESLRSEFRGHASVTNDRLKNIEKTLKEKMDKL